MDGDIEENQSGSIALSFVISHRVPPADASATYKTFRHKGDGCMNVVLRP